MIAKGRHREAAKVRTVRRAAAVGRLMLREFSTWEEFLEADTRDYESLPRRQLKALKESTDQLLRGELATFNSENFADMTVDDLDTLYEEIKSKRGLNIPLSEFEKLYSKLKPNVYAGRPRHSTINLSLWGMQFEFPEDHLCKDVTGSLEVGMTASRKLDPFRESQHADVVTSRSEIAQVIRDEARNSRACIVSCFNLVECFLNGLAWDFVTLEHRRGLSNREEKLLRDIGGVSLRDKLVRYPRIISGRELWTDDDELLRAFLEDFRPYRDSLIHPSPFSVREEYGGYDKLQNIYKINCEIALIVTRVTLLVVERIRDHIQMDYEPVWIEDLRKGVDRVTQVDS